MRKLALLAVVSVLAACAEMQPLNESLKTVNATLAGTATVPMGQLGDGSGYQPKFPIEVPGVVCNRTAFIDGFKDDFITNWNQFVRTKINLFQAQLSNRPNNKAASQNLSLYKSHLIGTKGYTRSDSKYVAPVEQSFKADLCPSNSYMKGRNAGMEAVARERKILTAKEMS